MAQPDRSGLVPYREMATLAPSGTGLGLVARLRRWWRNVGWSASISKPTATGTGITVRRFGITRFSKRLRWDSLEWFVGVLASTPPGSSALFAYNDGDADFIDAPTVPVLLQALTELRDTWTTQDATVTKLTTKGRP